MRKYILGIFILYSLIGQCQNTWFKVYPNQTFGITQNNLVLLKDTLYHYYAFYNKKINFNDASMDIVNTDDGTTISSDSLTYSVNANPIYTNNQLIYHPQKGIVFGLSSFSGTGKSYNGLYLFPSGKKIDSTLQIDTLSMSLTGLYSFGNKAYCLTYYIKESNRNQQQLWSGKIDKPKRIIYSSKESRVCASCHREEFSNLLSDIQDSSYLYLVQLDFRDASSSWEADIIKLDTLGNLLWTCRPNIRDSFCTSFPTVVQKPNGNLIISWLDQWRKAYMSESQVPYETVNKDMTLWFAEIDHQTGKVLWRKNISQYLDWKTKKDIAEKGPNYRDIYIKSAKLFDDNSLASES